MGLRDFERVIVRGHEIPLQLFCSRSDRLEPGEIEAVVNIEGLPFKPAGGLWTSTFTPYEVFCSAWIRWCANNLPERLPKSEKQCWVLYPSAEARVAQISSIDDYRKVLEVAKRYDKMKKRWCIDWEKLAMLCDGLWLTEDGLYSVGYAEFEVEYPELVSFYGWDAESIVWFRWVFDKVISLPKVPHSCKVSV